MDPTSPVNIPQFTAPGATTADATVSSRNVSISRKVNKLLDVDTNDQFRQVLIQAEEVCPQLLTPEGIALRGTRLQSAITQPLQRNILAIHDEFLLQLKEIRDVYRAVASDVKELEQVANDLHAAMSDAATKAEPLVTAVTVYREELREIKAREAQVKELVCRYNVTDEERAILSNGPIDEAFLRVIQKVRSIHLSCRELLIAEHQQAVIEIMESMYLLQVQAVERLAQFLCTRCSEILTGDTAVLSDFFIKCVAVTFERPAQFTRVINEVSRARKSAIIRRFYDLLSRGGAGHQPLDSLAGDAVRFVSTLLSWIHQAIAEEEDLLRCFFPRKNTTTIGNSNAGSLANTMSSPTNDPSLLATSPTTAGQLTSNHDFETIDIKDVLDQIFEPLCQHFRARFDQVTDQCVRRGGGGAFIGGGVAADGHVLITFFQLEGVLSFYSDTISQLLSPTAGLAAKIEEAKLDTLRVFYNLLQAATGQMLVGVSSAKQHLPKDLAPTTEMETMLNLLEAMLNGMSEGLVPHSKREAEMAPVLGAVVDPLVSLAVAKGDSSGLIMGMGGAHGGAASHTQATGPTSPRHNISTSAAPTISPEDLPIARLVFGINILSKIQALLDRYSFTWSRRDKIAEELAAAKKQSSAEAINGALAKTLLAGKAALLANASGSDPSHMLEPSDVTALEAAAKHLYSFVYTVGALPAPFIDRIQNVKYREETLRAISSEVCDTYQQVYEYIHSGQQDQQRFRLASPLPNGAVYADAVLQAAYCHTPKHLRVLLDVEGPAV